LYIIIDDLTPPPADAILKAITHNHFLSFPASTSAAAGPFGVTTIDR
jgi:hypothetical protein